MPCAIGERHILPRQTMSIFIAGVSVLNSNKTHIFKICCVGYGVQ
jgi:hypothetical protein